MAPNRPEHIFIRHRKAKRDDQFHAVPRTLKAVAHRGNTLHYKRFKAINVRDVVIVQNGSVHLHKAVI